MKIIRLNLTGFIYYNEKSLYYLSLSNLIIFDVDNQ